MKDTAKNLYVLAVAPLLAIVVFVNLQPLSAQTFQHPGVLVSRAQLSFIKTQVNNGVEPFHSAFLKAQNSRHGSLTYKPQGPPAGGIITCGAFSNPDIGCGADDDDSTAAYLQAVLWTITGNHTYAANAINLLNTYGHRLKGFSDHNAPLQAAWSASKWTRAAEIIRYSNAGWAPADIATYRNMLKTVYVPQITNGSGGNGNWELAMIEAMIGIAVFNNDRTLFNHAVTFWHQRVPAYFYYFPKDGGRPVPPPRGPLDWHGQTVFNASVNGIGQETCRDFGHMLGGMASTLDAAETAHIQGVDLYASEEARLTASMEFHAKFLLGAPVPSTVCGGHLNLNQKPTFEIGYNDYHNRLGVSLAHTLTEILTNVRSNADPTDRHITVYETLTHGGDAGTGEITK
jgi:hypothetical protein